MKSSTESAALLCWPRIKCEYVSRVKLAVISGGGWTTRKFAGLGGGFRLNDSQHFSRLKRVHIETEDNELPKSKQLSEMTDDELREYVSEYLKNSRKLLAKGMSASIEEVQGHLNNRPIDERISWFRREISGKISAEERRRPPPREPTTFSKIELTEIEEIDALLDGQKLQLYAEDYRRTKFGMTLGMSRMSLDAVGRLSHSLETEAIPLLQRAWDCGGDSGASDWVLSQLADALHNVSDVRRVY